MGHSPIPPRVLPTRLEALKVAYVKGSVTVEQLEERAGRLLAQGLADDPAPLVAPPKPGGASSVIAP